MWAALVVPFISCHDMGSSLLTCFVLAEQGASPWRWGYWENGEWPLPYKKVWVDSVGGGRLYINPDFVILSFIIVNVINLTESIWGLYMSFESFNLYIVTYDDFKSCNVSICLWRSTLLLHVCLDWSISFGWSLTILFHTESSCSWFNDRITYGRWFCYLYLFWLFSFPVWTKTSRSLLHLMNAIWTCLSMIHVFNNLVIYHCMAIAGVDPSGAMIK